LEIYRDRRADRKREVKKKKQKRKSLKSASRGEGKVEWSRAEKELRQHESCRRSPPIIGRGGKCRGEKKKESKPGRLRREGPAAGRIRPSYSEMQDFGTGEAAGEDARERELAEGNYHFGGRPGRAGEERPNVPSVAQKKTSIGGKIPSFLRRAGRRELSERGSGKERTRRT